MAHRYAVFGVGGYVARKHLNAIRNTGGEVVVAHDISDSVGILDEYNLHCSFSTDIEDISRLVCRRRVDTLVVCTPNYLHEQHIRWGLQRGLRVLCEKPVATSIGGLEAIPRDKRLGIVMQLRNHPIIRRMCTVFSDSNKQHRVKVRYFTERGPWYLKSWKGDVALSGGLVFNIGIHVLDALLWVFGQEQETTVKESDKYTVGGQSILDRAHIDWRLSICGEGYCREIEVDGRVFDFTKGFGDLHSVVYSEFIKGNRFGLAHARPSIAWAEKIRGLGCDIC